MMLKQLFVVAILSHSAFCRFAPNERQLVDGADAGTADDNWRYCEDECKDVCEPCEEHHVCAEDENKCGEGPTRVSPSGVVLPLCPKDELCVDDICYCPVPGDDGELCPVVCDAQCNNETELICPGGTDDNGCTIQEFCHAKGHGDNNIICPGFCPVHCDDQRNKCDQWADENGCATPPVCEPIARNHEGDECYVQQCTLKCEHTYHLCLGDVGVDGCKDLDICVPKQAAPYSEMDLMCPGTCPETCNDGWIKCDGTIDYSGGEHHGCVGQEVCRNMHRNTNNEVCPGESDSHGCPHTCPDDEVLCPAKEGPLGCKEKLECIPRSKDDQDDWCPESSDCPTICPPYHVNCPGGIDPETGCKNPDQCIEEHRDFNGDVCPVHCPENCEDDQVFCPGTRSPINGCYTKDKCEDKEEHLWGPTPKAECPGWCPATCNAHEVLCPSYVDPCNGCPTEEICREAIKDKNGIFCAGKEHTLQSEDDDYRESGNRRGGFLSASHNCPVYCKEWEGEVQCPVYEDSVGCKPEASCVHRNVKGTNEDGTKEYCSATSVCPKECPSHQKLCHYTGEDNDGCTHEDICVDLGKDFNDALCKIDWCPPLCTIFERFVDNGVDASGCKLCPSCEALPSK